MHSHEFDLPKKVRALGLRHALSSKAKDGAIVIIDEAKTEAVKTKALAESFGELGCAMRWSSTASSTRISSSRARNLRMCAAAGRGLNVYDILKRDKLVLTTARSK